MINIANNEEELHMNTHKVKTMLNVEILNQMNDRSAATVLKNILFDENNSINWEEVYKLMITFMPELKLYDGYKAENMR